MGAVEAQVRLTGGCQCGAVRYRLEAAPTGANICHCRMCQKASGGPFMAFAGVRPDDLVWTRGAPKVFASSAIAERGFCADCGTPLTYRLARPRPHFGDHRQPRSAVRRRAEVQYGVESRLPWLDAVSVAAAARHRGLSRRRRRRLPPASRPRHLNANRGHAPQGETA